MMSNLVVPESRRHLVVTCCWFAVGFLASCLLPYFPIETTTQLFTRPPPILFDAAEPERLVEHTSLALVLPFLESEIDDVIANLATWNKFPPCQQSKRLVASNEVKPTAYLYSPSQLPEDLEKRVKKAIAGIPWAGRNCFHDFEFVDAGSTTVDDYDSLDIQTRSGLANDQFYYLMNASSIVHEGASHLFLMQPGTRPIQSGWLDELRTIIANSEPFWIRGSAFRPRCTSTLPSSDSADDNCPQLGPHLADHINANALYAVGDPLFHTFLQAVKASEVGDWPFDVAWQHYLRSPAREKTRRSHLKNFVYSDVVQHVGSTAFDVNRFAIENPWTFLVNREKAGAERTTLESLKAQNLISEPDPVLLQLLNETATPDKNVMIAFGTKNYLDVLENFVHFVHKAGIQGLLLIAMDVETASFAANRGYPHYAFLDAEIASLGGSDSYTSDGFKRIVNKRSRLISNALRAGFNVLQSDVDVIWLKNPFHFYFSGDFEYEIQSDARVGFSEKDPGAPFAEFVNSGLFYARGTPHMADFYDTLIATVSDNPKFREQHLLNLVLQDNVLKIHYRVMDPMLFPNGFQYFTRTVPQRAGVEPFCIHNNWLDGGAIKQYRFREIQKWVMDDPDYFSTTTRKYLRYYEPTIAGNGWNNVRNSLRAAMAIAQILDRTLILPKFYSHHNNPTTVTLDYFLDYPNFVENNPNFRESSFVDKVFPSPPSQIFNIDIGGSTLGPLPPSVPLVNFTAKGLFRGATDEEIKTWFEPYDSEPLISLSSAFRRFHKFVDEEENAAFERKLQASLQPAPTIIYTSNRVIQKMDLMGKNPKTGVSKWNCAHIRRGDFPSVHKVEKTVAEIVDLLATLLPTEDHIYITSDESSSPDFRYTVRKKFPRAHFWADFDRPWYEYLVDPAVGEAMRLGSIESRICAAAKGVGAGPGAGAFVGNIFSTFTTHICYLRNRMGLKDEDACRDIYGRKYPPDWEYY